MNKIKALPPLGNRIIKTSLAVFICMIIYTLSGFRGSIMQSAIAAIICIQPYVSDSKAFAMDRITATIIGSAWGFLFLGLMYWVPILRQSMLVAYFIMSIMVGLAIYSSVILKKASSAALVAIVYMGIVVAYPDVDAPYSSAGINLLYTILGTLVAILVNISHFPRQKHPEKLFFVRTQDLVPDRYQQIPSSVHTLLDLLYNDGAKICLVSRWAPAFIISQMGLLNVNAPMILMNGAALYDIHENRYLELVDIPHDHADRLLEILDGFGVTAKIYTVRDQSMCIYQHGKDTDAELQEYEIMRRSPYRNYLQGTFEEDDKITIIRIIDTDEKIDELAYKIKSVLPLGMFRLEIHEETHFSGYKGLYFYDQKATIPAMKRRMLDYMRVKNRTFLTPVDILPQTKNYKAEHDAPILLHRLKNAYEPVSVLTLFHRKKRTPKA